LAKVIWLDRIYKIVQDLQDESCSS